MKNLQVLQKITRQWADDQKNVLQFSLGYIK